jgi:hypothetical protein
MAAHYLGVFYGAVRSHGELNFDDSGDFHAPGEVGVYRFHPALRFAATLLARALVLCPECGSEARRANSDRQ